MFNGSAGYIPIAVLFGTAYLLARAWMVTDAGRIAIAGLTRLAGARPARVLLGYTLAVAGLSVLLPSFVAALGATPFVRRLAHGFRQGDDGREQLTSAFAAACMWGANVGGKGSIVGSPTNAILVVYLGTALVPGHEKVNYLSWLVFGIPLSLSLALVVWLILYLGFRGALAGAAPLAELLEVQPVDAKSREVYALTGVFIVYWLAASIAEAVLRDDADWPLAIAAIVFGAVFLFSLFRRRQDGPLLLFSDTTGGIPWRGIALIAITAAVSYGILVLLSVDTRAAALAQLLSDSGVSGFVLMFAVLLLVIFATELASNTVVALTFFPVALAVAPVLGIPALPFLAMVSLASTAGYMTPMATPANALVVGEVKGVRLGRLVMLGLFLDVAVAAILALWGMTIIPRLL